MHFEDIPASLSEDAVASEQQERPAVSFEDIISEIDNADVTVYEKLNPTNMKAARDEFLSDSSLVHPNNIYGNLNLEEVSANLTALDIAEGELAQGR